MKIVRLLLVHNPAERPSAEELQLEFFKKEKSRLLRDFVDLNEKLGEGTFGAVRKFKNKLDGNIYAIKKIEVNSQTLDERTKGEVQLLSRLQHDNIIRYYNCWTEDFDAFPKKYFYS